MQVMHQGIGFPLRPVANAPPDGTGDLLNSESVAVGAFMQFMPQGWEEGKYHSKGSVVTDSEWTMVANQLTLEYPYPTPVGDDNFGIAAYAPTTLSDSAVVYSGHFYTFNEPVWWKSLRVWVTELTVDTNYRIVIIVTPDGGEPTTTVIDDPLLLANGWAVVSVGDKLIRNGTVIEIYIDALNSGADNQVTGGWTFEGAQNIAAPPIGQWNHNLADNILRINKTDLDSTNRGTELLGITVNSTIQFVDTLNAGQAQTYRVNQAVVDSGAFVSYAVTLQSATGGGVQDGATTTMTATVPIPQPTEYAEQAAVLPSFTQNVTVVGYLAFDGVKQVGSDANTYGIDIEIESTTVPQDWDVMAYIAP